VFTAFALASLVVLALVAVAVSDAHVVIVKAAHDGREVALSIADVVAVDLGGECLLRVSQHVERIMSAS
jgi:hypothetical protein